MDWYMDPSAWSVPLTDDGPADWQRVADGEQPEQRPQQPVTVSNVETTDDSIEFDVSQPGTPILVKTSYFPNWKASGADGPWRVTPNLMVVVPTSTHVELHYGYTGVDALGYGLSLIGLLGLVWLWRAKPIVMPPDPPRRPRRVSPDPDEPPGPQGEVPAAAFDPASVILGPSSSTNEPPFPLAGSPPAADD
jgi:hypothetical protein